jgi:Putative transposase
MALTANEFIRRFLLHVLPEGFQRIRYYGFLSNRCREEKLARCRQLLAMPQPEPSARDAVADYRDLYEEITGTLLRECPACHHGRMLIIDVITAIKPCPTICDTS